MGLRGNKISLFAVKRRMKMNIGED